MMKSSAAYEDIYQGTILRRLSAMVLRYYYLLISSWPRLFELLYWPFVQMLMWGFLQKHLATTSSYYASAAGVLIGSILLWDILVRCQLGFSISFLEEMWSRNIGHLLMSPLRPNEFIVSLMMISLIRLLIAFIPVSILAYWFFGFNIWGLGLALLGFFAMLSCTGWALGMITTGVILRYGLGAEGFAWTMVFILLPLCCVYYPLETLPDWLQYISLALPPTHIFEGLRALVIDKQFVASHLYWAFGLNVIYLASGFALFHFFLRAARNHGTLLQMGE